MPSINRCGRLSFPFFLDPNFNAAVRPIEPCGVVRDNKHERWDGASEPECTQGEFSGTYGQYLLDKVSKVFPELERSVL